MVMPEFLAQFYPDLKDPRMEGSVVVFHQRIFHQHASANGGLAHPYRYLAHNGKRSIRYRGNRSWARRAVGLVSFAGVCPT